ncbi:putative amp-CoA ligase [Mycena polygramma]|nr:putative amp-CoA ligase [Mycena polygramma]
MSATSKNHFLSLVRPVLRQNPERLVFRPYLGPVDGWSKINGQEFDRHMSASAAHWAEQLGALGLVPHDVVGVWFTGKKYEDLINILGLCAAGYVPQLFSIVFPNPDVIWDLLAKSNAKALILDSAFASNAARSQVPTLAALSLTALDNSKDIPVAQIAAVAQDAIAVIVHSSGTTSGTPKLIPTTHSWISTYITNRYSACQGCQEGDNVMNTIGSLAHVASLTSFLAAAYRGYCTAQSPAMGMSTEELMRMAKQCGLNRLVVYATFLAVYIKAAQTDPEVLETLRGFRQIVHGGVALNREDEEWAYANGLPITAMYATSETATLMATKLGNDPSDRLLRLLPGGSARLIPYNVIDTDSDNTPSASQLWEMVLPSGAPDSPHSSLIADDGLYHTKDVFEEVQPGFYIFRGRRDDWLKTVPGLVDTKAIEDNVRKTCEGLLHDAVVLGTNRTKPCLFVEANTPWGTDEGRRCLIDQIIERTKSFNDRLLAHERINNPNQIRIVPFGTLPRNKEKGNIRRNATEQLFSAELDIICS